MSKIDGVKYSFFLDRLIVIVAYIIALMGAWVSIQFFQDQPLWMKIAIGDFVGTVIIFIYSLLLDPYIHFTISFAVEWSG